MADPVILEKDGFNFANRAVECDSSQQFPTAIFYYTEAAQALLTASMSGSRMPGIIEKAQEYLTRVEVLKQVLSQGQHTGAMVMKTQQQMDLERAQFLLRQAFDEDEGENKEEASELYMQAVEMFIKIRQGTSDSDLKQKVGRMAEQALDRAETLKKKAISTTASPKPARSPVHTSGQRSIPPLGFSLQEEGGSTSQPQRSRGAAPPSGGGGGGGGAGNYSREEIEVLRKTSLINGREFVPFMSVDIRERFAYPLPFSEKKMLTLSPKQQKEFGRWVRPDEICENPQMIYAISSFSIKQTVVSDCSFVASLAISAQYERRFQEKLITSIIYPQNRKKEPQYNPCGKYMVKLHINGVHRKVIIDDHLPLSRHGELLCSYSNNKNELWVSLLEKAYMKVMGGYDFPGSNSNIDLHALTGWIPERVSIRPGSKDFDADKEFKKVLDKFHKGQCLVTMATGDMGQADADRAGLVPTHAYALLDIQIVKGHKLIMLKNPWSHLRWRGNFSELDTQHWTPELQKKLNYDPKSAQQYDNGVFWIDYESLQKFYEVMYINWNPKLFPHTTCMHHTWTARDGPKKDVYNIGDNPQYRLEVRATQPSAVWVLLTRHITDRDDFAHNKEFITVLVYKSGGKRVFYPFDPPPFKDGVRINSPHYLVKMVEEPGTQTYTLVVSQYEKNNTIRYTLRVYASCPFSLSKISEPYNPQYEKALTGQWKGVTAGGCGNYRDTHKNNPIYQVTIDNKRSDNHLMIELKGPKQYSVGFEVVTVTNHLPTAPGAFTKTTSGDFRRGFCVLQLENIPGGVYNIQTCTFYPKKEGHFFLNISSSVPVSISQLQ